MKYPTNPSVVPHGGSWPYTDPDTGISFKSSHIDALLGKVRKSRIANGHKVGAEWVVSFYNNLCEQNPQIKCSEEGKQEVYWNGDDLMAFLGTLLDMRKSDKDQVDQDEFDRRIGICMRCPLRAVVNCATCGAFGSLLQRVIAGVRITDTDAYPMSCMACGCSLISKAAYPLDVLKGVDERLGRNPPYDKNCWMLE